MKRIYRIAIILAISSVMIIGASIAASASSDDYGSFSISKATSSTFTVAWNYTVPTSAYYYCQIDSITISGVNDGIVYSKQYSGESSISDSYTFTNKYTGFVDKYTIIINYTRNYYSGGSYQSQYSYYSYVNTLPKKISKSNFSISSISDTYVSFKASRPANATGVQYKLYSVKTGKCIATRTCPIYSDQITISKNVAYKYKVRAYYENYNTKEKYYGSWSSYRYFDNGSAKITSKSTVKGCKLKLKGVSKVSKYKIYVTTSSSSTKGKLTKTVTPKSIGKYSTYTINKIGKSSMKKGTTYYINVVPVIKSGSTSYESDVYMHTSFYNYR